MDSDSILCLALLYGYPPFFGLDLLIFPASRVYPHSSNI